MKMMIAALVLTIVTVVYLFWSRNAITRVPGYTTPLWQTPEVLLTPGQK